MCEKCRKVEAMTDNNHLHEIEEIGRKMQDRERLLDTLFRKTPDAIISINAQGFVNHPFNPAACEMFGYTEEELLDKPVTSLMPPPHSERHQEYIEHYLETGETKVIGKIRVVDAKHKDGSTFAVQLSVTEVEEASEHTFMAIIRKVSKIAPEDE